MGSSIHTDKPTYRMPFIVALLLHIALIVVLSMSSLSKQYRWHNSVSATAPAAPVVLNASAVDTKELNAQIQKIKWEQSAKQRHEQARLRDLEKKALLIKTQRQEEEKKVSALKLNQEKLKKQQQAQSLVLQQQQEQAKQAKAKALQWAQKVKKLKAQELTSKQNALQQALLNQQMQAEQATLKTQQDALNKARAAQQQGILDKYRAQILRLIQNNWHPQVQDPQVYCQLLVHLGPGGVVTAVDVTRTSGNAALDRSATLAIYKSSPLPVPQDAVLFDQFRELNIKMSPENITG